MMQLGGTIITTTTATATVTAAAAAPTRDAADGGCVGAVGPMDGMGNMEELGDRGFGGNRWPRQETLALLKIRSEMDVAFRDANVKGPLWEEVSRKLAELGYHRSSKKCKEKFENVYKYHKRTKDGRTGKSEGKTYRFFDQLEALENHSSLINQSPQPPPQRPQNNITVFSTPPLPAAATTTPTTATAIGSNNPPPSMAGQVSTTVPSTMSSLPKITTTIPSFPPLNPPVTSSANPTNISSFPSISTDFLSDSTSSSSTSSDLEMGTRRKRKRKWKDFLERVMKQVVEKQEELHIRFLEAVENREHERMVREESWRMQEIARINREREILAQERSMAAAKDAAVMAFLQKLSENQNLGQTVQPPEPPQPTQPVPAPTPVPAVPPAPAPAAGPPSTTLNVSKTDNGNQNFTPTSSSRWPKVEIEALIQLRTNLEAKYQDNGPKGPLWEEISAGMRRLGYNRSSKRCKEKWENINKYFKKVKESSKRRPEDSKTCPYFHQLDALYREKTKFNFNCHNIASSSSSGQIKLENSAPLMVQPEQQWPPANPQSDHRPDIQMDIEGENFDHNPDDDDDDDDDNDVDDDDDDEGGDFEIVPNNNRTVSLGTSG